MLSKEEREEQMPEYNLKQDKARCLIFERLNDTYLRRIDISHTISKLDNKNTTTYRIGLIMKWDQYYQFKFNPNGNFFKFLDIHEAKAKDYMDAGGIMTKMDRVMQLHSA